MTTDAELIRRYVEEGAESAFAEIVQRHLGIVYSAALRRTNGNRHLAEEVSQKVFIDLARKSIALKNHPTLAGWLYRSTRYAAIDLIRNEDRRKALARNLPMTEESSSQEAHVDWEELRPVLDEAMDALKEPDRELMLLRFFHGLTFAEVGQRLRLSENAARMRTERALDKLRLHLGKRGLTSTAAALGVLLANQAVGAAPAGLSVTVTSAAIASGPANGLAGISTIIFMSKVTAPFVSALAAVVLTAIICTSTAHQDYGPEIATLRQENARLEQAITANALPAQSAEAANAYASQAVAVARAMTSLQEENSQGSTARNTGKLQEISPRGYRNQGNASPKDAALTFAYACDLADPSLMAKMLYFDEKTRADAQKMLDTMPETIRSLYPTPEAFYGLCIAAGCIEGPPPRAELAEMFGTCVETGPGRFATRRRGSDRNIHEYQLTADGWKYIVPPGAIAGAPGILNNDLLYKLSIRQTKN